MSNIKSREPLLKISNLSISFFTRLREIPAVMDFSCELYPGDTIGLVGESGCGKSTVALGVMRDLGVNGRIVGGSIEFKGQDLVKMSPKELQHLRGSDLAMVYQEPMASLNPSMTVGQQLCEVPMTHQNSSRAEAMALAREMVSDVHLPDPDRILASYPHQLSGGQQQRIVIAMALMSRPSLLILDEPTTALDVTVEAGIIDLVKGCAKKYGTSILFISHNLGLVMDVCNQICVMYSGEAVEVGGIDNVFDNMRHPYTQALLRSMPLPSANKNGAPLTAIPGNFPLPHERPQGCNFGPRCQYFVEGVCNSADVPMADCATDKAHHESRCLRFNEIDWQADVAAGADSPPVELGEVVLDIQDLQKYYQVGGDSLFSSKQATFVKANESVSIRAREGETVAIVGESGCGKSTLAKVLLGLETASGGQVSMFGKQIQNAPVENRSAKTLASVQMVFQNPFDTLNPSMTVGRQIIRALEIFRVGEDDQARRKKMYELLELVKLPSEYADRTSRQLSGGQKQRVGIARAFAGEANIIVADEPVSALDVSVQASVTELLMDIQRQSRMTMIFISHDLSIVRYLSDQVVVMYLGHVVESGPTDAVFSPPYHPYTEALLSAVPIADTSIQRKRIVLSGDIPSAINTPNGCPFQTRCHYKSQVAGNLCETQVPSIRTLGTGHQVKCHLADDIFDNMEPVIVFGKKTSPSKKTKASKPKTPA